MRNVIANVVKRSQSLSLRTNKVSEVIPCGTLGLLMRGGLLRVQGTLAMTSIYLAMILFAPLSVFASTPYSHPDEATGQHMNNANGEVDYIRFSIIRGAPRKNQTTNCAGNAGMLYHKVMRADSGSPYTDELRTCVTATSDWTTCTQGLAYQRTRSATDGEILSADLAVGNAGRIMVGWIEASGTVPNVTIKYFVRASSDNGATWWPVYEAASYQTDSFSVPYDVDLAVADNNDIGMLVFLDQSAASSNQMVYGYPRTEWLVMLKFKYSNGSNWLYPVLDNANPPDLFYIQGSHLFDLVGGSGDGMFHALYSQNRDLKISTHYSFSNYTRTIVPSATSSGVLPRGSKRLLGLSVLADAKLYDVPDGYFQPNLIEGLSNYFFLSANEFSNNLVLQSPIQPGVFDIAIHTVSPAGVVSAPIYPVNDPLGLPRCQDNVTNVGAQCSDITHMVTVDAQPNIGELGALVGNDYYIPALVTTKTWDSGASRYYDTNQRIIIAQHDLNFPLTCPAAPKPRCMKPFQKGCVSVSVNPSDIPALY